MNNAPEGNKETVGEGQGANNWENSMADVKPFNKAEAEENVAKEKLNEDTNTGGEGEYNPANLDEAKRRLQETPGSNTEANPWGDYATPMSVTPEVPEIAKEMMLQDAVDRDEQSRQRLDLVGDLNLPPEEQERILNQEIAVEDADRKLVEELASDEGTLSSVDDKLNDTNKAIEGTEKEYKGLLSRLTKRTKTPKLPTPPTPPTPIPQP